MRLLITGICGFAGSTLARALLEERPGLVLAGLDNLSREGAAGNVRSDSEVACYENRSRRDHSRADGRASRIAAPANYPQPMVAISRRV